MKKIRVGIFGGTFNPPHIGHIQAAKAFIDSMNLDKLLVIPTFMPPHKMLDTKVSSDDRLNMCRLAFSKLPKVEISDLEIKRGGTSYTYLTLQELSSEENELYFLCGTDMFISLDSWRKPEIIFSLAKICFIRREDDALNTDTIDRKTILYKEVYGAEIFPIASDVIDVSSSEIRNQEKKLYDYLSQEVIEYVSDKELYK